MKIIFRSLLFICVLAVVGCSSTPRKYHAPPIKTELSDPIMVIAQLREQLSQWYGTPYHYGGMDLNGIDCSGFVYRTFNDRFAISLPRTTKAQTTYGTGSMLRIYSPVTWYSLKPAVARTGYMSAFMILTVPLFMPRPAKV